MKYIFQSDDMRLTFFKSLKAVANHFHDRFIDLSIDSMIAKPVMVNVKNLSDEFKKSHVVILWEDKHIIDAVGSVIITESIEVKT